MVNLWQRWAGWASAWRLYRSSNVPSKSEPVDLKQLMGEALNAARIRHHASLVSHSVLLDQMAQTQAEEMSAYLLMSHRLGQLTFHGRASRVGYRLLDGGEVIAGGIDDPVRVVEHWLASTTNRAVILAPYRQFGIGLAYDVHNQFYWVLDLANPRPSECVIQLGAPTVDTRTYKNHMV